MVQNIVNSRAFETTNSIAITLCSILLGLETYMPSEKPLPLFLLLDWIFTAYFLIEIILRLVACGSVIKFYKIYTWKILDNKRQFQFLEEGIWNWLDSIIVIASGISLFAHLFEHPEVLAVMRLFRVFRILRLLEVSKEMKQVEMKIISIIPTIFSFGMLLLVLLYIYAIVGVFMFQHHTYQNADFSNLQNAALTLFQCMTLEGWTDIMHQSASQNHNYSAWFVKGYFISFIILTVIVSFNVFVAVLTSQVQEKISQENKQEEEELQKYITDTSKQLQEKLKEELIFLRQEIEQLRTEIQKLKR
ncbi:MAG: ion transporter [Bacteroidia bacterium]|nr:ion transporter [Bacteroidia bacterium]MDW8345953.1 ion transporter [Bacteroidia bacterium]